MCLNPFKFNHEPKMMEGMIILIFISIYSDSETLILIVTVGEEEGFLQVSCVFSMMHRVCPTPR